MTTLTQTPRSRDVARSHYLIDAADINHDVVRDRHVYAVLLLARGRVRDLGVEQVDGGADAQEVVTRANRGQHELFLEVSTTGGRSSVSRG